MESAKEPVESSIGNPEPLSAERADSVRKHLKLVLTSHAFAGSKRCQDFLRLVVEHALDARWDQLRERMIGVEMFGRPVDYDTSNDAVVRVKATEVRKRLTQFYHESGKNFAVRFELPSGSYVPEFRWANNVTPSIAALREGIGNAPTERERQIATVEPVRHFRLGLIFWLALALLVSTTCCLWLAVKNQRLRSDRSDTGSNLPALDYFWRTAFPTGKDVQFVVSDANLTILSDLMGGRTASVFEYRSRTYPRDLLNDYIPDTVLRSQADHISGTQLTPFQDMDVLRCVLPLSIRYGFPLTVAYARDFRVQPGFGNLILVGHKRENPWVEVFEPKLNFRYQYVRDGEVFKAKLINLSPRPGEARTYEADFGRLGYSDIAYLPRPGVDGNALLIGGTDMSSIAAGGHFMTTENSVSALLKCIGVHPGQSLPYFEVLLKADLLVYTVQGTDIISCRIVK